MAHGGERQSMPEEEPVPKRRRGVGVATGSRSTTQSRNDDILWSVFSRLDDHFDLARCSAVCGSWNRIIEAAHLMRDLYYKRNPPARGSSSNISVKSYFEMLAMDMHPSAFSRGPAEAFQWIGHPIHSSMMLASMLSGLVMMDKAISFLWR